MKIINPIEKIEEMKDQKQSRSLKKLIKDFRSCAGRFDEFNTFMDLREKILFKGWLTQMRKEIPRFAIHDEDLN
jgi:hypothetical protein